MSEPPTTHDAVPGAHRPRPPEAARDGTTGATARDEVRDADRLAELGIHAGGLSPTAVAYLAESLVNVIGVGSIDRELAVDHVVADIGAADDSCEAGANCHHLTLPDGTGDTGAVTLTRSGTFILTGVDSVRRLDGLSERLAAEFASCGIHVDPYDYVVRNLVVSADLFEAAATIRGEDASEDRALNLGAVVVALGLTSTEYNPEMFPGAIYNAPTGCSVLLFNNGSAIVTGSNTFDDVWATIEHLVDELGTHGLLD